MDPDFPFERTTSWNEDEATFSWDEYIDNGDWWSGETRYESATQFVEEAQLFGRTLILEGSIVGEIGGLDHHDVYSYDQSGRLSAVLRTTRDIVRSSEVTRYLDYGPGGLPIGGLHDYLDEDENYCLGAAVEFQYDEQAMEVIRTVSMGTDLDGEECGRARATREVFDEEHLLVERSLWVFTDDTTAQPDRTYHVQNTETAEICVD